MKKIVTLFLVVALGLSLVACAPSPESVPPTAETDEQTEGNSIGDKDVVWPTESVTLYVPSTAGGFGDTHARIVAQWLQDKTGVPFAVVNQAEGGGSVAFDSVRNAKPDGNSLLFYHSNFMLACVLGQYEADPITDFTTIAAMETGGSQVVVVSAKSPYQTLDDYINAALEKPDAVTFGIQAGGASQIIGGLLEKDKDCELKMVEAGNQTEKIASLLGGFLDACNIGASAAAQYVESGDMRVLCSISPTIDPYYPDFIPAVQQGYPAVSYTADFYLFGAKDMDPALVKAISETLKDMETDQALKEQLAVQTSTYVYKDPATSEKEVAAVTESLREITTTLGMK